MSREQRPRVLIEDANPALAASDFAAYADAGFDVAVCSGPEQAEECPVLRGADCPLAANADVALFGPDRLFGVGREVLEAFGRRYPATARLVSVARRDSEGRYSLPEGCTPLPFPTSVSGQVDAVRSAFRTRARSLR
jgi:hypothetical protein